MCRQDKIETILEINTGHIRECLNLLCNTDELMDVFTENFLDTKDLWFSIARFQTYLKSTGRGQGITAEELQDCINRKDYKQLKELIQELLLIPIDKETLDTLKTKNMRKFWDKCKEYSNISILEFKGNYLTTFSQDKSPASVMSQ